MFINDITSQQQQTYVYEGTCGHTIAGFGDFWCRVSFGLQYKPARRKRFQWKALRRANAGDYMHGERERESRRGD